MLERSLAERGFVFVRAADMRAELEAAGPLTDWPAFAASWNDLEIDRYLAEGQRSRSRRFAVYSAGADGAVARQPHQPHYQHREYNALFGGIERWFAPIAPAVGEGATMTTVVRYCARAFGALAPAIARWRVEAHQFRIAASAHAPGQPTPEGVHRDGVDFVLVLLVNRQNIVSGVTTVYDLGGAPLGTFTLTEPCDATLVDDNRVAHGVTPVAPLDPARPGARDVLVVTFRRGEAQPA
ncbi:MAG: 2OG-Fe dioxygenase family protein [Acidobacteriia bacterium]|nr:2OG-Fe dioxygenase family protein [Terriglobia bacterium]